MLLIERLRAALAPDYEVERELAGGGMGIVFAARQRRLDRPVAIKLLRPELATAIAAERFLVEGRVLAKLSHPNIVPVFDAGESDGLLFYVMELIEGETLAGRLERGPLSPGEAIDLARDLLAALGAAHAQGVVHRDIKPANIFLRHGRALLGDFGIARWREASDLGLTTPGQLVGTPRYMAPEQRDGSEATALADVYAAGMVIYEACTGIRWPAYQVPGEVDWRRVPRTLVPPLKRALELAPEERWQDGKAFGQAVAPRRRGMVVPLLAVGALAAGFLAVLKWSPGADAGSPRIPAAARAGVTTIVLAPFEILGEVADSGLADSVASALRGGLSGYLDLYVLRGGGDDDSLSVRVRGTVRRVGSQFELNLTARDARQPSPQPITVSATGADWRVLTDTLAIGLVRELWQQDAAADPWLPMAAIPRSDKAFSLWLKGEQYLSDARWEDADREYRLSEQADTTCYLCSFRRLDIDRWLNRPRDPANLRRLGSALHFFPDHYQTLIHAALTSLPARLDTLKSAAETYPDFFLTSFVYGDELFHRGPLYGRSRRMAIEHLERAVRLKPRFAPGWEHLAWLRFSEGNAASVAEALDSLALTPPGRGLSTSLRVLFRLGMHWKFLPPDSAERFSQYVLLDKEINADKDAAAGARFLMTVDAPYGAVRFGRLLTTMWRDRADAVRQGLLGQLFGYAALGQLDSVRKIGIRLGETPDQKLPLLALELEVMLRRFDPDPVVRTAPDLARLLDNYLQAGPARPLLRRRAAWARGLLATGTGDSTGVAMAQSVLADAPRSLRLRPILDAAARGARGDWAVALTMLPSMPSIDTLPGDEDGPVADAVVRLLRAEWLEQAGNHAGALDELLWHEHLQTIGHLPGAPQPGELAWAVGTLARWHRTRLLGPTDGAVARCGAFRAVARHWERGQAPFAARADSARAAVALDCKTPS